MTVKIWLTAALALPTLLFANAPVLAEDTADYKSETYAVDKDTYCNNWFISVGAGEKLVADDNEKVLDVGEHIIPTHDVTVSKWLSPGIGVRAMFSELSLQGTLIKNGISAEEPSVHHAVQTTNQMNLHADILYSASKLIFGYKEQRIWNVIPYANYPLPFQKKEANNQQNRSTHIFKNVNNKQAININLNIEGIFSGNHFPCNRKKKDGIFSATLALTYSSPDQKREKVQIPIYNDQLWRTYSKLLKYSKGQEKQLEGLTSEAPQEDTEKE